MLNKIISECFTIKNHEYTFVCFMVSSLYLFHRISVECKVLYVAIKKLRCLKKLTKRLSKVQWLLAKSPFYTYVHCKFRNARFECNDIVIFRYSHYPLDPNAKSSDAKGNKFSI